MTMNNIITYTQTTLDTFDVRPFCPVDSLVLSSVAYIHFPSDFPDAENFRGVCLKDFYRAEYFEEMFHNVPLARDTRELFFAAAASPRFRDVRVMGYTEQFDAVSEKQFSAVTFQINPQLFYIAFRGTDSTLIGWKEDFNMTFQSPIPSQKEAVRYIEKAALHCSGKLLTGGHSKGGNLAVYAAAMCQENVKSRIERVFSHDGPGFLEATLQTSEFLQLGTRVEKTLPQSSVVGMLLEHQANFQIVKSNRSGILQHDQFSWIVEDNDFIYIEKLSKDAKYADRTLTDWLKTISEDDRERFVDSLYSILNANNLTSVDDLRTDWQNALPASFHAATQLDADTRKFLLHTLKELAALSIRNMSPFNKI